MHSIRNLWRFVRIIGYYYLRLYRKISVLVKVYRLTSKDLNEEIMVDSIFSCLSLLRYHTYPAGRQYYRLKI